MKLWQSYSNTISKISWHHYKMTYNTAPYNHFFMRCGNRILIISIQICLSKTEKGTKMPSNTRGPFTNKCRGMKPYCCPIFIIPVCIGKAQVTDPWYIPISKVLALYFWNPKGRFSSWNVWFTETPSSRHQPSGINTFHTVWVMWFIAFSS